MLKLVFLSDKHVINTETSKCAENENDPLRKVSIYVRNHFHQQCCDYKFKKKQTNNSAIP